MLCALQSAHTDMLPTFKYQFIFDVRVPFVTFSIFGILMMVCQQKVLLQCPRPAPDSAAVYALTVHYWPNGAGINDF